MKRRLPRILIDLTKLTRNYLVIKERCARAGITLTAVVKGVAGDRKIYEALVNSGMTEAGDSRLENLRRLNIFLGVKKVLLRLPAINRPTEVLNCADLSLNAEAATLERLDSRCRSLGKEHEVFLMVDSGDLREGVFPFEIPELAKVCRNLKMIKVTGIGTNFSCFAGMKPSIAKFRILTDLADGLREEFRLPIDYVSGGNSSSLPLLYQGLLPEGINHLRVGEGFLLGRETLTGAELPDLHQDVFTVEAEVVQTQWKPAISGGETGRDAFGMNFKLPIVTAGYRSLLNIGRQDTPLFGLRPLEPEVTVLGGSSDYLVLAGVQKLPIGKVVRFRPDYWGLLALMTSKYVAKEYLG